MPEVLATGFLVGLLEWACIRAINPISTGHENKTVGIYVDVSHEAATPPGFEVTVAVELVEMDGRRLISAVEAHDGVDLISKERHERFVINKEKFGEKFGEKIEEQCITLRSVRPVRRAAQFG